MKFVGPSYNLNARKVDGQRSINVFPVKEDGGSGIAYLDSVAGLRMFSDVPAVEGSGYRLLESGAYRLLESGGRRVLE